MKMNIRFFSTKACKKSENNTVMCKSKDAVDARPPTSPPRHTSSRHKNHRRPLSNSGRSTPTPNVSASYGPSSTEINNFTSSSTSHSQSSRQSLSSLRSSLPENPHLYDISEIRSATNNFLSKPYSTKSSAWRCTLHGKDVIIFQRKSHNAHLLRPSTVRQKLSSICKSHHIAIVNLVGASISGDYVYLVYDFINGASLHDVLHNKNNPNYTVLSSWMSRMQIATDLANGIDYIHNNNGLDVTFVHNHIKSSSVIITEPSFNAKICHFGAAELCGEPTEERDWNEFECGTPRKVEEIVDEEGSSSPMKLIRSNSIKFNGTTGYMSPEFQTTGIGTRKSDVYAFGVVLVELLSGEEAVKYKYSKATKEYVKMSAVEAARAVVEGGGGEREGRLRKWVDRRLQDSYPVEVAEKMTRLAVECLHVNPDKRPNMRRVAGKISKLYLESHAWCDRMKIPTDFTVSFAPR